MNLYADLLFTGGPVYTADPARPWAEAVAVRGGRILAVGRAAELAELRGPDTEVIDLAGKLLLPGFTESHIHFIELALRAAQVEATEARSAGEVAELVRAKLRDLSGLQRPEGLTPGFAAAAGTPTSGPTGSRRTARSSTRSRPKRRWRWTARSCTRSGSTVRRCAGPASPRPRRTCRAGSSSGTRTASRPASCARTPWTWSRASYPKPDLAETTAAVQAATPGMWATGIVALHNANDTCDGLAFRTYQESAPARGAGPARAAADPGLQPRPRPRHRPAQRAGRCLAAGWRRQDVR